jgi:hypothetical protein
MKLTASIFDFINELNEFLYELSGLDRVWNVLFPHQGREWHHLNVTRYKHTFYITHISGNGGSLEVEPKKGICAMEHLRTYPYPVENHGPSAVVWEPLIVSARKWLKVVRRDWIKANKRIQIEYPLRYRYGIAPNALVRDSLSDIYRLDKELGMHRTRKFVRLVEEGFFLKAGNTEVSSMTASDYFKYCKIAYVAGKRK